MKTAAKILSLLLIVAANVVYVGNYHYSNCHCGNDDLCFEIWNMNLIALAFMFMSMASIIPFKFYWSYVFFVNMVLYCGYDIWERAYHIYEFRKHDIYAIMFSPVASALIVLLFYIYIIKPLNGKFIRQD